MTTRQPSTDAEAFDRLRSEWSTLGVEPDPVSDWDAAVAAMSAEVVALRAAGLWRTGRRTLLGALGLHHDEVVLCRGLAWILTPDAWHGLGSTVLDQLLSILGVATGGTHSAVVTVEEARFGTRADIVVRFGEITVLIEAKIWAHEQPTQCDRLAYHWTEETPTLVFLTRTGSKPVTAVESRERWQTVAWSDIADLIESAVANSAEVDVGVQEYLRTLRTYGGRRA